MTITDIMGAVGWVLAGLGWAMVWRQRQASSVVEAAVWLRIERSAALFTAQTVSEMRERLRDLRLSLCSMEHALMPSCWAGRILAMVGSINAAGREHRHVLATMGRTVENRCAKCDTMIVDYDGARWTSPDGWEHATCPVDSIADAFTVVHRTQGHTVVREGGHARCMTCNATCGGA